MHYCTFTKILKKFEKICKQKTNKSSIKPLGLRFFQNALRIEEKNN